MTIDDALAARRRARFVGRTAERELFGSALDAAEPPFAALFVHGPGGVGKTTLLDAFADLARAAGVHPVRIDARQVHPSPGAVLEVLSAYLDVPRRGGPIAGPGRFTLLVDSYEGFATLDRWFRDALLPRLPGDTVTVLAGRAAPAPEWRSDLAWTDLLRVVSLRGWAGEESRSFLRGRGIGGAVAERLADTAHGHPLTLALLADVVARGGEPRLEALAPDLIAELVRRMVDTVPDATQRAALAVCALARVTTEPLLQAVLGASDGARAFGWLAGLAVVDGHPDGLIPHELAREVLDVELRRRDGEGYRRTFRATRAHVHAQARAERGRVQQDALFDEKFLFRNLPGILSPVDWPDWGRHHPQPIRPEEHSRAIGLIGAAEGVEAAAVARRWLAAQPDGFHVVRRADATVRGVLVRIDLTRASPDDLAADPGASAAWRHCRAHAPVRAGESVTQTRFVVDAEVHQGPSPTMNAAPVLTIAHYLATPRLAWDYLTLAEPDRWDEYFAIADLPRAVGADFTLEGLRFGLFAHDFRRVPVDSWLELVTERALARDFAFPPPAEPLLLPLAEDEFAAAVRQGLRDLDRPDLLARNPLLRTRLLAESSDETGPDAAALATLLREAVASLSTDAGDDKLFRALDRTFLRRCSTQEAAARMLGLPFSTYRRHLVSGTRRVVDRLWDREIHGGPAGIG
ncbi:AAA family ATPase [Pseudonocardia hydrocarbonoxydans]|uniref:Uncharacterized protein n=1 Tax=Pseudonocardia hydrocarbonoxydans TaxID=76726 RepID=A0A4Y3WTE1_9PSEU|nr:ATP-binding protein [Pseudonocardia hydrocarbonoxydans]GEC21370.1 hypothetical protein PHY01_36530 [Pseudonocardia hydrocarbonoxydans]